MIGKFRCARILFSLILCGATAFQAQAQPKTPVSMTVQVAKTQIRASPSVVAPILATVEYRAKIAVYESADGWAKVQVPGSTKIGYMFLCALTEKTIRGFSAGKATSGVTSGEIALAGKGFNESVEESYRKTSHVDYVWVDVMEDFEYSPELLIGFLNGETR